MSLSLTGANIARAKAYNLRLVLETIRRQRQVSRAGIARSTTLSAPTVSNIVRELIEGGFVVESGRKRNGRGSPSITLELNADRAVSVGLDLGREHLTGVLVDLGGTLRERIHHEIDYPSPDEAIALMRDTVKRLVDQASLPDERLWGVGVGMPGPLHLSANDPEGGSASPDAFPGWTRVPVAHLLADEVGVPVRLENNATAAAIGERWYGSGQNVDHFAYVYFGVGLGGGLIVNGTPFTGFSGNAGELGYLAPLVDASATAPRRPLSGRPSSERPSLAPHAASGGQSNGGSTGELASANPFYLPGLMEALRADGTSIRAPSELQRLYEDGHPILLAWLDRAARHLAPLLAAVCYLLDPQSIFFGGRLPAPLLRAVIDALPPLLAPLRIPGKSHHPRLSLGDAGGEAAALGAATLPVYEAFVPAPELMLKTSSSSPDAQSPFSS
jgi:predicted NBD/HSP70 family sugar kinase